jgi:glycosyltransferase involved in cell wall biosynthesis
VAANACRGQFVVELDHDDELLPDALEIIVATFLAHTDIDFVFSDWIDWEDRVEGGVPGLYPLGWGFGLGAYASEVIDGRRVPVGLAPPLTWETVRHIVAMPNHVRAWRTDFYRRIGGHDHRLAVGDDYELVLRSLLNGMTCRVPRPLYVQHHDPSGGNTSRRRNAEIQQIVQDTAERYRHQLDQRCLSFGVVPAPGRPLTAPEAIRAVNAVIDVVAEAADDKGAPLVSVVVPTYRRPELLQTALQSIFDQSYQNFEILLVGDNCPFVDDVVSDIDDVRLRHWNLPQHLGDRDSGAGPRNYALKTMARGTLIAYLDDDNTWTEDHLQSLVGLLQSDPTLMFAFSSISFDDEIVECRRPRRFQIDTSALLHRRILLERFGYWKPLCEADWAHDWELVSRWDGEPWAASLQPTARYRLRDKPQVEAFLKVVREVAEEERLATLAGTAETISS